jgi:DNA repair exonuclease SbcCD nuclease subunit
MKFLHVADIHLDSPLHGLERYEGAPVERIRSATRQALERVVELALEEEVAFVLIAGDLYDGDWKDYNTGLFFSKQMARLREIGARVFVITGNHDAASNLTRHLRLPEHVRMLSDKKPETVIVEELGVAIHGQGFAARKVLEDLSAAYPPPVKGALNLGLLHTSATGHPAHDTYAPCTIEGLVARGYDYWALGHVHTRAVLHRDPWIVFPGNIQGRHIREPGAKGCSLVTVAGGRIAEVEHRACDVLRWGECRVDASGAADAEAVIDRVCHGLRAEWQRGGGVPLAVRVRIAGPCEAHPALCAAPEKWLAEVRNVASEVGEIWIEKVKIETTHQHDLADLLSRDDPMARLVRSIYEMEATPALLDPFLPELEPLKRKLPAELHEGDELAALSTPEKRRQVLEEVRQLLLPRLLALSATP